MKGKVHRWGGIMCNEANGIEHWWKRNLTRKLQERYFQAEPGTHLTSYSVNLPVLSTSRIEYELYEQTETCNHFCYRVIINT